MAAALAGAWLALQVAGGVAVPVGPLDTRFSVEADVRGGSEVVLNPFGQLSLPSHRGPTLRVEVRAIDEERARRLVRDPTLFRTLQDRIVADVRAGLVRVAWQDTLVATGGAALAGLALLRSWRRALLAGGLALVTSVASLGVAALTWDASAVQRPRFQGLMSAVPSLIGDARTITSDFQVYADQLSRIVTGVSRMYDTTLNLPLLDPSTDYIRVLHVSDLHLNPAAWDVMAATVEQFQVDVVVDSGDIADHGTVAENAYVSGIARLGVPYVYVRGNHDSRATEAAVGRQPLATVLGGDPVEVAGLRFMGAPDPRFTPDKDAVPTTTLEATTARLGERARAAGDVDLLVIHDPSHAELLDGAAPLVLAGHAHRRRTTLLPEQTRVMVQGSTGGAGLRALDNEAPTPVMLNVLYLDPSSRELVAWDEITLGGLGVASAQIERRLPGDEDVAVSAEEVLDPTDVLTPDPTRTPTAGPASP